MSAKERIEQRIALLEKLNQDHLKQIKENEVEPQAIKVAAEVMQENRAVIRELKWVKELLDLYEY